MVKLCGQCGQVIPQLQYPHAPMFTQTEMTVVRGVAQGLANRIIAEQMHRTEGHIKGVLTAIYKKLNIKSRYELIVACRKDKSLLADTRITRGWHREPDNG